MLPTLPGTGSEYPRETPESRFVLDGDGSEAWRVCDVERLRLVAEEDGSGPEPFGGVPSIVSPSRF